MKNRIDGHTFFELITLGVLLAVIGFSAYQNAEGMSRQATHSKEP